MRRFDKHKHIKNANLLIEERYVIDKLLLEVDNKALLREFNQIFEGKALITESMVLDVIGMIKTFLTSHRVGELVTALTKWILKVTGIDKDMNGIRDKCENSPNPEECSKMWIQRLSELLEKVHHKITDIIKFVIAALKYKTFKPSKEQKASVEKQSENFFTAVVIGCLIYYVGIFGLNAADLAHHVKGATFLSLIIPAIGTIAKLTDLSSKFKQQVSHVNSDLSK